MSRTTSVWAVAFGFVLTLLLPVRALADGLDGKWKQGPLSENYVVQGWLAGCGPAPPAKSSVGGGETITIHQEGDELSFIGGGRTYSSRDCYDPMPSLTRGSHSTDPAARTWRTHCSTPPNDPRRATMNTLVQATSDTHIQLTETGRYEITLTDGKCVADVTRSRTFDLISGDTPAPSATPAPTPPPVPTPAVNQCSSPGEPASLEVRPSRKIMRQGESFSFRALVLDSKGCATKTATAWAPPDPTHGLAIDAAGTITVAADAPEGTSDLTVTAAGKTAHVTVDVTSASHYDALLAQSGLNSSGESDVASTVSIASGSIGGSEAKAADVGRTRKAIFVVIVVIVAAILGFVAILGRKRSKRAAQLLREAESRHEERVREIEERKRQRTEEHAAQLAAHEASKRKAEEHVEKMKASSAPPAEVGTVCPSCRREYPPASTFCPSDGNRLVPLNVSSGAPTTGGNVCPTCRRGYDPGIKICPTDGDELVPHAMLATAAPALPKAKGKICPTCGARFGADGTFCGKDGTALVLLN